MSNRGVSLKEKNKKMKLSCFPGPIPQILMMTLLLHKCNRMQASFLGHQYHSPLSCLRISSVRSQSQMRRMIATTKSLEQQQQEYKNQMEGWQGVSKSSSEFVTHFVAGKPKKGYDAITVEDAIQSVLPRPISPKRIVHLNKDEELSSFTFLENMDEKITDDDNGMDQVAVSVEELKKILLQREETSTVIQALDPKMRHDPRDFPIVGDGTYDVVNDDNQEGGGLQLSPAELISLGSIWFLPASAPRDPALGGKPVRLELKDLSKKLIENDYLRVHHSPRRFPVVSRYNWARQRENINIKSSSPQQGKGGDNSTVSTSELPGVVVARNEEKGYLVIDKPPGIPVHSTVDNHLETVVAAVGRSIHQTNEDSLVLLVQQKEEEVAKMANRTIYQQKKKEEPLIYVVPPQRLDQNTSGLFVLGTKKEFAGYFANLLRRKTDQQLGNDQNYNISISASSDSIHKKYRCLVCLSPQAQSKQSIGGKQVPISMWDEVDRLRQLSESKEIVRHYLEPSIKSPRIFSEESQNEWLECLLRVTNVGIPYPVIGDKASSHLCRSLWTHEERKPPDCIGVVEIEVELLTGRTHQIRGQLKTMGFPLCGDSMYEGAVVPRHTLTQAQREGSPGYVNSELLALQCCELEFLRPEYTTTKKNKITSIRSNEWVKFRLEDAWWSTFLSQYKDEVGENDIPSPEGSTGGGATTTEEDNVKANAIRKKLSADEFNDDNTSNSVDNLPARIQLSPGQNKYVIIKAMQPGKEADWFVKSASPMECGGQFHADVAKDLTQELTRFGYDHIVMGGGRIDYNSALNSAKVYGFSYGFGKGDHEFVALLIEKHSEIDATFDNSDALY